MKQAVLAGLLFFVAAAAIAADLESIAAIPAAERGKAIAAEAQRRDEGFGDTVAELRMELKNAAGRVRTRQLTWKILEIKDPAEGDRSLTIFKQPRDIAGTAFLSWTHLDRADDQWLYLPSLKRVKRIASSNMSSAFVGSEFAYEDLLSDEVEKFEQTWIRDESCGDLNCFVVERRPRYKNSGYSKRIVWSDQAEFRPMKIEYYDRKERLLKTLELSDYRLHLDRFWRAHVMQMENHQTGKITVLTFSDFRFQTGLTPRDLDPAALRRLR